MAFQPIRTQESGHVIKANNIDQSCVFRHILLLGISGYQPLGGPTGPAPVPPLQCKMCNPSVFSLMKYDPFSRSFSLKNTPIFIKTLTFWG